MAGTPEALVAIAPGEESYQRVGRPMPLPPESPYSKPQMGYFRDAVCGTKEGDSGSFAPPGAGRYAMQMSGMTVDATR